MKLSIGSKIFGLAIFLLLLCLGQAVFFLWHLMQVRADLNAVARRDLPLAISLAHFNEYALRRRLAFERWFGALNAPVPNPEIISAAGANYTKFGAALKQEAVTAKALLARKDYDAHAEDLAVIRTLLEEIEEAQPAIERREKEILEIQTGKDHARANDLLSVLHDEHELVQTECNRLQSKMGDIAEGCATAAAERDQQIMWLTLMATLSVGAIGLVVAKIVTVRLVSPMRALMGGMQAVQTGDLTVELPLLTRDEIRTLTESFNFMVRELRDKVEIKNTFGKYLDPRVLDQLLLNPQATIAEGRAQMTVTFCDLVGFSSLGERLTPSSLVKLLNQHFSLQSGAVQSQHGVVDKFIGDCVMAYWGPPFNAPGEHPELACRAALAQITACGVLRAQLPELTGLRRDLPVMDLRIGISTGEMIVGNLGSETTRSFTVIGDSVNLGSRLQDINRIYGTKILISETTEALVRDSVLTREIDSITVKGKTEPARVFELIAMDGPYDPATVTLCSQFANALAAYRQRDWSGAEAGFRACLALAPNDGPSLAFIQRLGLIATNPPPADWAGVWHFAD